MEEGFIMQEEESYSIIENEATDSKFENFIIAGVPEDLENIKDIERIIKVSVISQRFKDLPYLRKNIKIS